jgi:hypothetical protein
MTTRIAESELARDVRAVLEKFEQGSEVNIEQSLRRSGLNDSRKS